MAVDTLGSRLYQGSGESVSGAVREPGKYFKRPVDKKSVLWYNRTYLEQLGDLNMDYTLHYVNSEGEQGQLEFYAESNLEMYEFVKDFEQNHPNYEVLEITTDE